MVGRRSVILEFAILGVLQESSMHGYELRKRLHALLGTFRAFSYGSLYPCLKDLLGKGWIAEESPRQDAAALGGKRSKIVYRITAEGKEHLQTLLSESGPSSWEDENFGVHFAFFARTDAAVRLRILEGRRSRLEERLEGVRAALARTRERVDSYTLELQRHGLESVEREVRWLNELIQNERGGAAHDEHDDSTTVSAASTGAAVRGEHPPNTTGAEDQAGTRAGSRSSRRRGPTRTAP